MASNSETVDHTPSSVDSNCFPSSKCKTSLRLRLGRVFSSGGLSPKSPKSVSSSRGSSPNRGSPHAKTRYSWQPGSFANEENRSPRTPESGISTLSSSSSSKSPLTTNTPKSPSTPTKSMYFSTWYADERNEVLTAATAAEAEEIGERRRVRRRDSQPNVAAPVVLHGAQELVGILDTGGLPLPVHRNVRLDARVPARVDAAPGRLLKAAVSGMPRDHREQESR